jgi:AmiR/NasT family two-component response regulator
VAENPKSKIENPKSPGCILWEATVEQIRDPARVARLRACLGGAPVVAIVGFPRPGDVERARASGISAVIAKPFAAGDLFWHLERAIAT